MQPEPGLAAFTEPRSGTPADAGAVAPVGSHLAAPVDSRPARPFDVGVTASIEGSVATAPGPDVLTPAEAPAAPSFEPVLTDFETDPRQPTQAPPEPSPGAAEQARSWPRWIVRPAVIFLVWRVLTWATLAVTTVFTHAGVGGEIDRWDTRWFIRAAEFGWPSELPHHHGHVAANTIAFLPAFPLSVRWAAQLTGFSFLTAGVIVTSVSGLTATIAVWMLIRAYADQDAADRGTLLVAMFPGSFVLSMVYSEGFVVTFVAFGILALMRRRWLLAGVLGLLATATTPVALAFEISCLWCAYREVTRHRNWRSLLAPVLTPVGFLVYQVWLWFHTGNPAAWTLTQRGGWKSYPSLVYAAHTVGVFLKNPIATNKTDDLLFVCTVLTAIAAVIAIRSRMPTPALLYGLAAAGMAFVSAPVGLRPRFMFLAFPLIIAVGTRYRGRAYFWLLTVSMALLVFATAYEVSSWAVFP